VARVGDPSPSSAYAETLVCSCPHVCHFSSDLRGQLSSDLAGRLHPPCERDGRRQRRFARRRILRTVIDGAAQYERGIIRARTRAALDAKRARDERVGSVPSGFALGDDGVRLVSARREQATIARAHALRVAGLSLRAGADKLVGRPLQGKLGKQRRGTPKGAGRSRGATKGGSRERAETKALGPGEAGKEMKRKGERARTARVGRDRGTRLRPYEPMSLSGSGRTSSRPLASRVTVTVLPCAA
jgi:hypothetical protein